jgi:hypothetical protein
MSAAVGRYLANLVAIFFGLTAAVAAVLLAVSGN